MGEMGAAARGDEAAGKGRGQGCLTMAAHVCGSGMG